MTASRLTTADSYGPSPEYLAAFERMAAAADPAAASGGARGLVVRFDHEIESLPPVPWLAEGIIPANALTALYGAPGAGKSFVALDLALSVSVGRAWFGRPLRQGGAMYLAAEGLSGLSQRIRAWKSANGYTGKRIGAGFITVAIDLLQPVTPMRVIDACTQLPSKPSLVVIDTLARSMVGDENDTGEMSRVVAHADAIRIGTGATVLLVHHTRKDSDLERGSSALRGAVDTLLLCRESDDGRELVCEKQKDAEHFSSIPFRLVAGHGSCTVHASVGVDPSSAGEQTGSMTPKRCAVLRTLYDGFTDRGASTTEWLKASGTAERTFFHVRTWLCRQGYVVETGNRYTVSPSGKYAVTANCQSTAISTAKTFGVPRGGLRPPGDPSEQLGFQSGSANGNTAPDDSDYADLLSEADERLGMRNG